MTVSTSKQLMQARIEAARVLIVDDDHYMRRVVRAMLYSLGVRHVHEAEDGMSGLEAICVHNPDIVIVDWEMPMLDGAQFVQMVRSPGEFPVPDVPIIMLSGHGDRWRVLEAARAGAHEYLLKPVSTKALFDRMVSVLSRPRPTVRIPNSGYYGPAPRNAMVFQDPVGAYQETRLSPVQPPRDAAAPAQPHPVAPQPPAPQSTTPQPAAPQSDAAWSVAAQAPMPAGPRPAGPAPAMGARPQFGRRGQAKAAAGTSPKRGKDDEVIYLT